jgi:hypothetical protein
VATNVVDGLFGRFKRWAKRVSLTTVTKNCYGMYFGEFLWREVFLGARYQAEYEEDCSNAPWREFAFFSPGECLAEATIANCGPVLGAWTFHDAKESHPEEVGEAHTISLIAYSACVPDAEAAQPRCARPQVCRSLRRREWWRVP